MHIYFSGIGGTGIGPLALIALQAGHEVSGSDKQDSHYISYLKQHGISDIHIGQSESEIKKVHSAKPIDWYVYSSALPKENPHHPELIFVQSNGIRHSKRDELLNHLIKEAGLKLIAVAGTHGKSTTTAMVIWLYKELGIPLSYSVGAKIGFGEMGQFDKSSNYFVYECDEFDRNFLAFNPYMSLISGIAWDHHEVFPTEEEYIQAFKDFLNQSDLKTMWYEDYCNLDIKNEDTYSVLSTLDEEYTEITLNGNVNRRNAWLAIDAVQALTDEPLDKLIEIMNRFPGLSRRMEQLIPGLYSDYAHTPEKIMGAMETVMELAKPTGKKVAVIYEPLTNRRMYYTRDLHKDIFKGADAIYWVPSYLAREDPEQAILTPEKLIKSLSPELQSIAAPMELDNELKTTVQSHLNKGDIVIAMSGGGGNSLDEWLRKEFA